MDVEAETGPAPPTLRVVGGGEPTPEELAALLVALSPTAPPVGGVDARPAPWLRAAMIEGVGGRPPVSPADLAVTGRHG